MGRWGTRMALAALALFLIGLPIGMAIGGRHQPAPSATIPAAASCPTSQSSRLLVIPAGVMR